MKLVEDRRDRIVVILAGYPDEMAALVEANPGMQSRFPRTIRFDDYNDQELLEIFLQVDRESDSEVQETSLRGVRKAQVKLATFYLMAHEEKLARQVFQDMAGERAERLASIRDELMGIRSAEFWEISDRGVNFDYLSPERKEKMLEFFGWFGARLPALSTREEGSLDEPAPTAES